MALGHVVNDAGIPFSLDPVTRMIINESSDDVTLMQYDHNSEQLTFEIPRYFDNHDMSLCNLVQIHYTNIDASTKKQSKGVYIVTDLHVSEDDENIVVCTWLISCNVTKYAGTVNFLIRFACEDDAGTLEYVWNSNIFKEMYVNASIYNGADVLKDYVDVLEVWKGETSKELEAINTILETLINGGAST